MTFTAHNRRMREIGPARVSGWGVVTAVVILGYTGFIGGLICLTLELWNRAP